MTNNASRAELLTQQADDLEEMISKEFADKSSQVWAARASKECSLWLLTQADCTTVTVAESVQHCNFRGTKLSPMICQH